MKTKIDLNNKMFINGKFHEIKGSEFNKNLKLDFIKNICKNNCLEIFYIKLFNASVDVKFDKNKARVFNYLLKLFLIHEISLKNIENDNLNLQIDERNVKTQAKYSLEDYLNIELGFTNLIDKTIQVTYFDSSNNKFIQVADVFSNIFYSNCVAGSYSEELEQLKKDGYIKDIFYFPQKK